jgi:hypothetical protein
MKLDERGFPVITPKLEFGQGTPQDEEMNLVRHEQALRILNNVLNEAGVTVWVTLDWLDEAFVGFPDVEVPALRALLRAYLDMLEFDRIRIKLFVRKDLFRKITQDGFVNLTHVNARRIDITWDDDDLLNLVARRLAQSSQLRHTMGTDDGKEIFNLLFPKQVDPGTRRPPVWGWILARIRDGNGVKPPRNLIDLIKKALEEQSRREDMASREYVKDVPVIESESLRRALTKLSEMRVEDTLLAEAGVYSSMIAKFRDGKSEHSLSSLATLLRIDISDVRFSIKPLVDLGFLEETGSSFKIPFLYRSGLKITQGKADIPGDQEGDEED